jgi:Flp pilus assembly protein TadD
VSNVKRTHLLGIAVLLLPLGGCALNPLPGAAKPDSVAKAKPAQPDGKQALTQSTDLDGEIRSAQAARKSGDLVGATKILSQLVLVAPDDARVMGEYGKALAGLGRSDDAQAFLERAIQIDPSDWTLFSAEGVALDQRGEYKAAQTFYARALTLKPGEPSVLNNDALSHMQSGDLDGAEKLLRLAMPGSPDDARIAQNLALVQSLKAAQPPKAMTEATPAPATAPSPVAAAPAPAPVQMASVTPSTPVAPAMPIAAAPVPAPVATAKLDAPAAAPPAHVESKVEALKSDPTVQMQALPKEPETAAVPRELPAKPEAAPAPEKKLVQAPAPKPAAAPAPTPKVAAAPAPAPKVAETPAATAPTPKAATPAGAPKLITAAARTPSANTAYYVQAGSFPTEDGATKSASNLDSMGARVMSGTVNGHAVYRVRIGPFLNIRQANAAIEQAHELGHADLAIVTE